MVFIIHTSTAAGEIAARLGLPEYSYRFVVEAFRPMLERLGRVVEVADPAGEVDACHAACRARGEDCVFLCFLPPNKVPIDLACPTIPVFAWEYDTLPNEAFNGKPRNDWTRVLVLLGSALTHSSFSVERTRALLGEAFPIDAVPAPLWNRVQSLRSHAPQPALLALDGVLVDSRATCLADYRLNRLKAAAPAALPLPSSALPARRTLALDGVLYTAIFNPYDGRKNWLMMISAFCMALRDRADATLLIKLTHHDPAELIPDMLEAIYKMGPCRCRVLLLHAYLEQAEYDLLLRATSFAVNASHGEGQCLPLMEYMSAGKPAVAPRHTAMRDYIDEGCAFVVESSDEIGTWPHDPRQIFRTLRQRIHFDSLVSAFRRSYRVAIHEPDVYAGMGAAAVENLRRYCSMQVVLPRLEAHVRARLQAARLQAAVE